MTDLSTLKDTSRPRKKVQRVGRGIGSKRGATSGRGGKGDSARQGYRKRFGYEGGQVPLYRKLPIRGFTRGRFVKASQAIGLSLIEAHYEDGVLSIALLKAEAAKPKTVEIQTGNGGFFNKLLASKKEGSTKELKDIKVS